jgi:hypothetical protein
VGFSLKKGPAAKAVGLFCQVGAILQAVENTKLNQLIVVKFYWLPFRNLALPSALTRTTD